MSVTRAGLRDTVLPVPRTYEKICQFDSCGEEFTVSGRGATLRKYCDEHFVGNTAHGDGRNGEASAAQKMEPDRCSLCGRKISAARIRRSANYCSTECSKKMAAQRKKERDRLRIEGSVLPSELAKKVTKLRRGDGYKKLEGRPELLRQLLDGTVSQAEGARELEMTQADMSRSLDAHRYDKALKLTQGDWRPSWLVRAMLPFWKLTRLKELGPDGEGTEEFERLADELTRAYAVFSRYFFLLEGKRPIIKGFHLKWIRSIIVAYAVGGKQLILSPPRHGKSEMLIRFVVWLISMDPNIRIMWIAASGDVAQIMLGAIKDHLESNELLLAAVLPPGETFEPDRNDGKRWTTKEIKVRQCTRVGQKSSTVIALGRTSKILSRDVDLMITDDIEDFDSTREMAQRVYSRNKLAEIGTRKEELTAWLYISSRQHPDDIPAHIMKLEGTSQAWRTIVNTAHEDCQLDADVVEGHDLNGCVLFPEVRSYRWLMEKKDEMDALGIQGAFEMRYLNNPIPDSGLVFDIAKIKKVALDRERGIGLGSKEEGWGIPLGRMAAGLDPSARGIQAAFLWHLHIETETLSMLDLEAEQSGGIEGAHNIMRKWHERYGVDLWFYEDNAQQIEFFNDPRTKALAAELGITIRPFRTGKNKQDPELGISSMAPFYHNGKIRLPYGTAEARYKVNMLLRQLGLWTTDGIANKKLKTDIKMASWFPFGYFIKLLKQNKRATLREVGQQSYPETAYNESPWVNAYPGR